MAGSPLAVVSSGGLKADGALPTSDNQANVQATSLDALAAGALPVGPTLATSVVLGKAAVPALAATGATAGFDCQTAAALTIGGTNATGVTLGKAGVNTTLGAKLIVPAATSKTAVAAVSGTCALDSSGTVTVTTTAVTATSLIFVSRVLDGGTVGGLYAAKTADIVAGTSFIIRSFVSSTAGAATAATLDTSTVAWFIVN